MPRPSEIAREVCAPSISVVPVQSQKKLAREITCDLARMTEKLCEHVYDLSELIKGIGRSNAMQGLHLIAVTQGLFVKSLGGPDLFVKNQEGVLQMCPVRQMFA